MNLMIEDTQGVITHLRNTSIGEVDKFAPLLNKLVLNKIIRSFKVEDECEKD